MKIETITFSGSNPSMGPHNTPSQRSLNVRPYPQEVDDLLDNTRVNGAVSLREYLTLRIADDSERVREVHQAFDCGALNQGQRIIDLVLELQDGPSVTLSDLRTFSLEGSGWSNFDALIREKGVVTSSPSFDEMRRKVLPTDWERPAVSGPDEG